jgi:ribosomal RNA-processing protein 12
MLLSLPPLPHLTPQIFSLLAHLLSPPPSYASGIPKDDQLPIRQLANLPIILNSLLDSPPPASAPADQVQYVQALTSGMLKLSTQDAYIVSKEYFSKAWTVLWGHILIAPTSAPEARRKAAEGLGSHGLIRYCVSEEMVLQAVQYKKHGGDLESKRQKMKPPLLSKVLNQLERAMATQPLMLPFLLPVLTALISRLRSRASDDMASSAAGTTDANSTSTSNSKSNSPAQLLLLDSVVAVADLRQQPGFAEKEKVDDVVGMAFEVMGVEAVLKVLPLNIEPDAWVFSLLSFLFSIQTRLIKTPRDSSGKVPQPGRAHLLPLMRSRITNDSLLFFTTKLVPMSERSFERKVKAEEGNRPGEAKVWEVVIGQIWDCLPGFVDLARDLREVSLGTSVGGSGGKYR